MRKALLKRWNEPEVTGSTVSEMQSLNLSHTRITWAAPASAEPVLLVLGGRVPDPVWLSELARSVPGEVWALDRGADACRAAGVRPGRLLGDFDSVSREGYEWARSGGAVIDRYPADKNLTDFQLALELLKGPALVTGCWGGRFDHAFSAFFSVLSAAEWGVRVLAFADERELLCPLWGPAELSLEFTATPQALSLLPLTPQCEGVTIENVKWPLDDVSLVQSLPWAVSNLPEGKASVRLSSGVLGVYAAFGGELE